MKSRRAFLFGIAATPAAFLPVPKREVQTLSIALDMTQFRRAIMEMTASIEARAVAAVAAATARGALK
jgi:hypothetical protein